MQPEDTEKLCLLPTSATVFHFSESDVKAEAIKLKAGGEAEPWDLLLKDSNS